MTGNIIALESGLLTLSPEANTVCGEATEQLLVKLADELKILTVTMTDDGSEIVPAGTLEVGQIIGMNVFCEVDGYEIDNTVIVADQRI
ncbi:MAG: hypothetical protein ACI8XC_002657 [Gammaproteobacteria bacterium]